MTSSPAMPRVKSNIFTTRKYHSCQSHHSLSLLTVLLITNANTLAKNITKVLITHWSNVIVTMSPLRICAISCPMTPLIS